MRTRPQLLRPTLVRFGLVSFLAILYGCGPHIVAYTPPALTPEQSAHLRIDPEATNMIEIARIDDALIGLFNRATYTRWPNDAVRVAPGKHAVRVHVFVGPEESAVMKVQELKWNAQAGHQYEVKFANGKTRIEDRGIMATQAVDQQMSPTVETQTTESKDQDVSVDAQ